MRADGTREAHDAAFDEHERLMADGWETLGGQEMTPTHWMDLPYEPDVSVRWMPIETAPTDGTQILLMKMPLRDQVKMAVADGFMANGRWVWPYVHKEPTHWMPMLTAH